MTDSLGYNLAQSDKYLKEIDVVIMWVDDSFDGYQDTLRKYAKDKFDTDPNRTRDNLELLRFCLRSLDMYLPEMRRLYLLTQRPQVPAWLNTDHPDIRIVHHDEIADPAVLPTFNSFSILSHVHMLPELGGNYVYLEDDMMLNRMGLMDALHRGETPLSLFTEVISKNFDQIDLGKESPWNQAMANTNRLLNETYGVKPRNYFMHGPLLFNKRNVENLVSRFAREIAVTRATRFRDGTNIPIEYLYPHAMVEEGLAHRSTKAETARVQGFAGLRNFLPWTWFQLWKMERGDPVCFTLNDDFGPRPNKLVEQMVCRWLNRHYPQKSQFEI